VQRSRAVVLLAILLLVGAAIYLAMRPLPASERGSTGATTPPTAGESPAAAARADDPCQGGSVCVLNPAVTQATIGKTICVRGWTATVRPPVGYTSPLKERQMADLHLPGSPADYEEDHRVPLELGGDPSAPHNLTPELRASAGGRAETKDQDENSAKAAVCAGSKTLAEAQAEFVAKWLLAWPGYRSP